MSSNDTHNYNAEGSAVDTIGGILGAIIIILLLLLALTMTALLYPRLVRPRMIRNKHLSRISKLLDSKIYSHLGYVSTSVVTTPDPTAAAAAITVQPSQPTSAYSTTNHVRYKETTCTSKGLQPPQMEYSLLGPPGLQYDYIDTTVTKSYPGMAAKHQHVEKEPALYSSANPVIDVGEIYEDTHPQGPLEYEIPVGSLEDARPLGPLKYEIPVGTRQSALARLPNEEYSRLKHH